MTKPLISALRALLLAALLLAGASTAQDQAQQTEEELSRLRDAIGELEKNLERNRQQRSESQQALREAELSVAQQRTALRKTGQQLAGSRSRQREIAAQQTSQQQALTAQHGVLATQLRAAYVSGRQERIRLMLNQENPATLGRIMVYYGYLNRERAELLAGIEAGLENLRQLEIDATAETRKLETLEANRREELERLEAARGRRGDVLSALDAEIDQAGTRLQEMQRQEQEKQTLLENLSRALAEIPMDARDPFAGSRGRMPWPLTGRLVYDFGQPRAGGRLRWQGVTLSAERGADVKAVSHGRVAYADWLTGMGLLLVIEHGDGYMSLYGHNEALYVEVGDWVEAGSVIAAVGDSGGNQRPALYFEIRQGRKPLNPHRWLASR